MSLTEWRERDLDRRSAWQRTQIETSKLLVTFSLGISSVLVVSSLQNGIEDAWRLLSIILHGFAFLTAIAVIFLDRSSQADQEAIILEGYERGWSDDDLEMELRIAYLASVIDNDRIVWAVKLAAVAQLFLVVCASSSAVVSLLE